jgi:cell division protein ZapA
MNAVSPESVKVKIMERDYIFVCAPDEKETLLSCVALVDEKMNAIKNMGKLTQIDRIAVMAALMIANDLITKSPTATEPEDSTETNHPLGDYNAPGLEQLQDKLDLYLTKLKPQLRIEEKGLFG